MSELTKARWQIIGEIVEERAKQAEQGYDEAHDDRQTLAAWAWLLSRRSNDLSAPNLAAISKDEPRRILLEIAAISVAAIEAMDRVAANVPTLENTVGDGCSTCGTTYNDCTKRLRKTGRPCCGSCGYTDTHNTRRKP